MREVTADLFLTADGYATVRDSADHFAGDGSTDLEVWIAAQLAASQVLLLGANTYEVVADPAATGRSHARLTELEKVVFSTSLTGPLSWENAELERREPAEAVRELRAREGYPLRVLGSPSLTRTLLAAGLVDRLRLMVFPQILGRDGELRLLDDGLPAVDLALEGQEVLDGTLVRLDYRVVHA